MSIHFYKVKVKDIIHETPECVSVSLDIPNELKDTFQYKPGQYVTFKSIINDQEVRRSYSICSAPDEAELRVAIKHVESGKFSGFANKELKAGDALETMPPLGNFGQHAVAGIGVKHYLAFAAGSGITPIFGIMKHILHSNSEANFTLVYGNKNRNNIIFKEGIEALKNKYMERLTVHHVFTRETADAPLFNGRINQEKVDQLQKLINYSQFDDVFICGPEDMILGLRTYFMEQIKLPAANLHFELFSSPDQPKTVNKEWEQKQQNIDAAKVSKVTIKLDGSSFDFDLPYGGTTILDAALQHGADLPYACKGGVCCTCRAKVTEGEVDMEVNYALEPDELANNFVLTCQSHPRTERVIIDFDIK